MVVTARLTANPRIAASARITVTPGFLQPLTPENVALGANGAVTVTGKLAVAGGSAGIQFALAEHTDGHGRGPGDSGRHDLPALQQGIHVLHGNLYRSRDHRGHRGHVSGGRQRPAPPARTDAQILLNTAGVTSNPAGAPGPAADADAAGQFGRQQQRF